MNRYLQVKMRFTFSDLRRFTNFAMRCAQYLEALHPNQGLFDQGRLQANSWELMAGVHWWLRQLELHAGLYRFWSKRLREAVGSPRPEQALIQAMANGTQAGAPPGRSLTGVDRLKFGILVSPKFKHGQGFSASTFREWLKARHQKDYQDLAKQVKDAVEALVSCGLLVVDEDVSLSQSGKKRRGRRVEWFRKAKWTDVVNSTDAIAEVVRLELARDHFEH